MGILWCANTRLSPLDDVEQHFARATTQHPNNSVFLEKKTYLGGRIRMAVARIVYAVGELRAASLQEDVIRQTYQDIKVKNLPLKVFLLTGKGWPQELPFIIWQDELWGMSRAKRRMILYI